MVARLFWSASILAFALALFVSAFGLRNHATAILSTVQSDEDRYYLPPPGWIRFFCLGYNEAAADVIWTRTIVYFGGVLKRALTAQNKAAKAQDAHKGAAGGDFTTNYVRAVVDLDPRFRDAYRSGAGLTLYAGGSVTERNCKLAIEILGKGLEVFPDDGQIAFNLGFIHYYEMAPFLPKDPDSPIRRWHRMEGVRLIRRAAMMPDAPSYVSALAAPLMKRNGMDDMVVTHLENMLLQETDPGIRATLALQLRNASGRAAERAIARTNELQDEWRRALPFVPFDLFLVIDSQTEPVEGALNPLYMTDELLSDRAEGM
ncbi:MAG: hypothetical protein PHU25_00950 [Deltaproteobacteria bacterium]|nr:hypothetical protein [Deltaproteobacteria bacterium]